MTELAARIPVPTGTSPAPSPAASDLSIVPAQPPRSQRTYRLDDAGTITVTLDNLDILTLSPETRTRLFEILDQLTELDLGSAGT